MLSGSITMIKIIHGRKRRTWRKLIELLQSQGSITDKFIRGAKEILEEYFKKIGGRPVKDGKRRKRTSQASRSGSAIDIASVTKKRRTKTSSKLNRGKGKARASDSISADDSDSAPALYRRENEEESDGWQPTRGIWEDKILKIVSIEQRDKGNLMFYIDWKDGHNSVVNSDVLYAKAPLQALRFYESHIQFAPAED